MLTEQYAVIAFGFYAVTWGQAKDKVMAADNVHSLESSTPKRPHPCKTHGAKDTRKFYNREILTNVLRVLV